MNNENIQPDTNKKDMPEESNRFSSNINSMFKLPIQYNNTIETSSSLLTDLELLETKGESKDNCYNSMKFFDFQ